MQTEANRKMTRERVIQCAVEFLTRGCGPAGIAKIVFNNRHMVNKVNAAMRVAILPSMLMDNWIANHNRAELEFLSCDIWTKVLGAFKKEDVLHYVCTQHGEDDGDDVTEKIRQFVINELAKMESKLLAYVRGGTLRSLWG